jgi:hypothetical protein
LKKLCASWVSAFELLPTHAPHGLFINAGGAKASLFTDRSWLRADQKAAFDKGLDAASSVLGGLKPTTDLPTTVVYSDGLSTVTQAAWNGAEMDFTRSVAGDQTIPSVSAAALTGPRVKHRPVPFAVHSELYAHDVVKEIIRQDLEDAPGDDVYIQAAIDPHQRAIAGRKNHIIVELRDRSGAPLRDAAVSMQLRNNLGLVGGAKAIEPSGRHDGQFEAFFKNPEERKEHFIDLRMSWAEGAARKERQQEIRFKVL